MCRMAFFVLTLHVGKTRMCHREACRAHWVFPDVTRPELKVLGMPIFFPTLYVRKTRRGKQSEKCHTYYPERATEVPE